MRMAKRASSKTGVADETASFQRPKTMVERAHARELGPKRAVNLTASAHYLNEAKAMGLNLSEIFDTALRAAVREAMEREIAEFAEWQNKNIAKHGLFGAKWRSW